MPQEQTYQSEFTGLEMDARFTAVAALQQAVAGLLADMANYYTKAQVDAIAASIAAAVNSTAGVTAASLPAASSDTLGKIYYIGPTSGEYARYVTGYDGTTYSWLPLGTTDIDLSDYATKEELAALDAKVGESETVTHRTNINPGTATGSLYVRYNDGQTGSSGVNSVFWKMDISAYAGKTLHYSRVQIPAASGLQGVAFYKSDSSYISGVQGVLNASAWGIARDSLVVPENAAYASFTCPTAELENFELFIVESEQVYTSGLGKTVADLDAKKQSLPIYVQRFNSNKDVIGGGYPCNTTRIATRFNGTYDKVWQFGNKPNTINRYFDFRTVGVIDRGLDTINTDLGNTTVKAGNHDTDYIAPVVVAAVNNKNGDFPDNVSYFTGGFHGYGNNTSGDYTPTMREISKVVTLDGVEIGATGAGFGSHLVIDVVNRLQGCNTEKEDGSGREILEQRIHLEMGADGIPHIHIEYEALEAVTLYRIIGLSQYFDFANVRFRGSSSKKGVYSKSAVNATTDKQTFEVENFSDSYALSVGLDLSKGIGDGRYVTYNAQVTSSTKGYFNLIQSDAPVELAEGDIVEMFGYFKFD